MPSKPTRRRTHPKVRALHISVRTPLIPSMRPPSVVVRFKAVGNAPIMRQNFYKITASNRFQAVIQFLRKELGWKAGDPLVCTPEYFETVPTASISNAPFFPAVHLH